jgi:biotin transport system ATP-binding protein
MNIIEVSNLSHRFPDGTLGIDQLSVTIAQGEFVVFAGANGSGKTTFFRHLNGLLLPEAGTVMVSGISVARNLKRARRLVGMVFQDADSQIVGETVYDDVAFGPENLGLARSEINKRVIKGLDAVGLTELAEQRPHLLSGGEKRKLAIAGILAMEAQILVFDEPFANLDYPGFQQVLAQIIALHQKGHTILLATHDLYKVISYCRRLIVMENGTIVKDGAPQSLLAHMAAFGIRPPCAGCLAA